MILPLVLGITVILAGIIAAIMTFGYRHRIYSSHFENQFLVISLSSVWLFMFLVLEWLDTGGVSKIEFYIFF